MFPVFLADVVTGSVSKKPEVHLYFQNDLAEATSALGQKRTCAVQLATSALCQKQKTFYSSVGFTLRKQVLASGVL